MNNNESPSFSRSPVIMALLISSLVILLAFALNSVQEKLTIQLAAYGGVLVKGFIAFGIFMAAFFLGSHLMHMFEKIAFNKNLAPGEEVGFENLALIRSFLSLVLGMGGLSFIILFLGSLRLLQQKILLPVFIIFILFGLGLYRSFFVETKRAISGFFKKPCDVLTILAFITLALLVMLYLVCALALPIQYDVLEYHLGAVEQSLRNGTIAPRTHVFYSFLPYGMESIYAAGMLLEGASSWYTPKFINLGLLLLCFAGIYLLLGFVGLDRNWGLFGAILFGMNRLVFTVGLDAFVEIGQTVYVLAALVCWFLSWQYKKKGYFYLSFIFWGFALGVKYSILGLGIIPFFAVLIPVGIKRMEEQKPVLRESVILAIQGAGIIFVMFMPWMLRNYVHTGNPFFPFFSRIFAWENWTPEQMEFYYRVNRLAPPLSVQNLMVHLTKWKDIGYLYTIPLILVFMVFRNRSLIMGLSGFALMGYLFWNIFLNPPARFLVPLVPVIILLLLLGLRRVARISRFGLVFLIPYGIFICASFQMHLVELFNTGYVKAAFFCYEQDDFLFDQLGYYKEGADFINETLAPSSRLLFLYEARSLYIRNPVLCNTVFDKSPLLGIAEEAGDGKGIRAELRSRGFTHVLVNEIELNRLIHTYAPPKGIQSLARKILDSKRGDIRPLFRDPHSNLTMFDQLYGPYYFDGRFHENRGKIRDFISLVQEGIVFERFDERGLRFYIAKLQ